MTNVIKIFKGGSLSSTSLIEINETKYVRKSISLTKNREYGFQRWYSQLKKLQRYSLLFPNLFPPIVKFEMENDMAYYDMPYIENSCNAQEFIRDCTDTKQLDKFFEELQKNMNKLYEYKFNSNADINLYIHEEVEQKLNDCNANKTFIDFLKYKEIYFNGIKCDSFLHILDKYKRLFNECYSRTYEVLTHGNITLENLLYVPTTNNIIFIDPYEENIIDSDLCEYSQLLQSSNAKYEIYNTKNAIIQDNHINLVIPEYYGINYINNKILEYINYHYNYDDRISIRLFEISQFIRMLPFKMAIDESKMIFFYGLASYLFKQIF